MILYAIEEWVEEDGEGSWVVRNFDFVGRACPLTYFDEDEAKEMVEYLDKVGPNEHRVTEFASEDDR